MPGAGPCSLPCASRRWRWWSTCTGQGSGSQRYWASSGLLRYRVIRHSGRAPSRNTGGLQCAAPSDDRAVGHEPAAGRPAVGRPTTRSTQLIAQTFYLSTIDGPRPHRYFKSTDGRKTSSASPAAGQPTGARAQSTRAARRGRPPSHLAACLQGTSVSIAVDFPHHQVNSPTSHAPHPSSRAHSCPPEGLRAHGTKNPL